MPSRPAIERHVTGSVRGERRPRRVNPGSTVGEDDRRPALASTSASSQIAVFVPAIDLGVRIELYAVDLGVPGCNRLPQRGQSPKRRVPVSRLLFAASESARSRAAEARPRDSRARGRRAAPRRALRAGDLEQVDAVKYC